MNKPKAKRRGGFASLVIIAWRNIWRNRRRTILCAIAVGSAVFFSVFMQSWIVGMERSIEDVVQTYETGHVHVVTTEFEDDREYYPVQYPIADGLAVSVLRQRLEGISGVRAVLPRITALASLFDNTVKHAYVWGIDIEQELALNVFNLTHRNDGLVEGRYPHPGSNECAVGIELARKAGLSIGDPLPIQTLSAQFSNKYWAPVVTGIFKFDYQRFDEDKIIVPHDRLQRILVLDEGTQQLAVYGDRGSDSRTLRTAIAGELGPGHVVREWGDNYWVSLMRQSNVIFVVISAVFQIVASFLIINTVVMVIHERIKEIGMMGALGMTRHEIVSVFFLEALFLSIIGAGAGTVLAGIASLLGSMFPLDMNAITGGGMKELPISGTLFLVFSPLLLFRGFLFGVAVSGLCTLIPSLKSAFIEPVEALRR